MDSCAQCLPRTPFLALRGPLPAAVLVHPYSSPPAQYVETPQETQLGAKEGKGSCTAAGAAFTVVSAPFLGVFKEVPTQPLEQMVTRGLAFETLPHPHL